MALGGRGGITLVIPDLPTGKMKGFTSRQRRHIGTRLKRFGWKSLKEYYASRKWKDFRNSLLTRDSRCEVCGEGFGLQLHHKTYQNLCEERAEFLVWLCADCHERVHGIKKGYTMSQKLKRLKKYFDRYVNHPSMKGVEDLNAGNIAPCKISYVDPFDL